MLGLFIYYSSLTTISGDGGATMTQPLRGFAHAAIFTMFNPPATPFPMPDPPTTSPSTTNNPTITSAPKHNRKSNAADIAGAVVGAVAGLAMVVGLSLWFLHRKSKKERYKCSVHQQPTRGSGGGELPEESECKELPAGPPPQELPADKPQVKTTRITSHGQSDSASHSQSGTLGGSGSPY